jgi:hydrogenase expression/formation protein HypE
MLHASDQVRCLRDPTRGGLATTLKEISASSGVGMKIDERVIPVRDTVRGACELLGLDPLFVANEGKLVAIVAPDAADPVLAAMRSHPYGREARIIGEVIEDAHNMVLMKTEVGGTRVLDTLFGEQLPRIC